MQAYAVHRTPAKGFKLVNPTRRHMGLSRPHSEAAVNDLRHQIERQRNLITRLRQRLLRHLEQVTAADRFTVVEPWELLVSKNFKLLALCHA